MHLTAAHMLMLIEHHVMMQKYVEESRNILVLQVRTSQLYSIRRKHTVPMFTAEIQYKVALD